MTTTLLELMINHLNSEMNLVFNKTMNCGNLITKRSILLSLTFHVTNICIITYLLKIAITSDQSSELNQFRKNNSFLTAKYFVLLTYLLITFLQSGLLMSLIPSMVTGCVIVFFFSFFFSLFWKLVSSEF